MFESGGHVYDLDKETVLKDLRDWLLINQSLERFRQIKKLNNDIMCTCPFHADGQEKKASMGISLQLDTVHCFTCGITLSFAEFISRVLGKHDFGQTGTQWLLDIYYDGIEVSSRVDMGLGARQKQTLIEEPITEEELEKYRFYHKYMWKRKLTPEIVEKFDVGFDKVNQHITFPVKDITGKVIFLGRRSVNSKFFSYPESSNKPIYGLYEALQAKTKTVIICESVFNALTCWAYGHIGIALFGLGSFTQYKQLEQSGFRQFILAFDGDEYGDKARDRFIRHFQNKKFIEVMTVPRKKDINDLSKDEFDEVFNAKIKI